LEGIIVGDKGRQVGWKSSTGNAGVVKSAQSGSVVEENEGGRDILWNGEKGINDVDDTTGKVDILQPVSRAWTLGEHVLYSLGDGGFGE
jgi:hypothetical protein